MGLVGKTFKIESNHANLCPRTAEALASLDDSGSWSGEKLVLYKRTCILTVC